jgi:DNA replication and repair protein RecF
MQLQHLSLTNFRNYARLEIAMPVGPLLLHGANAQGKTSLLESVYYLATGRSPWTSSDKQLLNWRAEQDPMPYSRVGAEICNAANTTTRLDITIYKADNESGRFKKEIKVNGVKRRVLDLLGKINVVMFLPQDIALVEGSPTDRRRYLNITLCQANRAYAEALQIFEKALEQRNAILRRLQEQRRKTADELTYWETQLIDSASVIISGRQRLLRELEGLAQTIHRELTGGAEHLELQYQPNFTATANGDGQLSFAGFGLDLHRQLTPAEIAPQYRAALAAKRAEEIARGITLIGPQRDELRFYVNQRDMGLYGSRGQARTVVMSLKLAEMRWLEQATQEPPVLLLDEFIAELDAARRAYLLAEIARAHQAILTTTEPDIFTKEFLGKATIWQVQAGQIDQNRQGGGNP